VISAGLQLFVAALIIIAAGLADAWVFRAFARDTDLFMILSGAGAMGIHGAYNAGSNAAATTPAPIDPPGVNP
jgi:hypothetical protein